MCRAISAEPVTRDMSLRPAQGHIRRPGWAAHLRRDFYYGYGKDVLARIVKSYLLTTPARLINLSSSILNYLELLSFHKDGL